MYGTTVLLETTMQCLKCYLMLQILKQRLHIKICSIALDLPILVVTSRNPFFQRKTDRRWPMCGLSRLGGGGGGTLVNFHDDHFRGGVPWSTSMMTTSGGGGVPWSTSMMTTSRGVPWSTSMMTTSGEGPM